jgi:asparagine synthase (glutamine-hydrolysing)
MCGIAGFIDSGLGNEEAERLIKDMLLSINYRGPDASNHWNNLPIVIGQNRLSIIDLSDDGNQPMHYHDAAIVFNGEIYNYIEVREQLISKGYTFKTKSDTEVILAAYREYGTDCVKHFVGMWAFALWDKKKQELFCSRDRFGIKPFYYITQGDKFYFGSEYKPLKKSSLYNNSLNMAQVSRGLQLGWVCYNEETFFEVINSLPAATNLYYKNGKISFEKYWDIDLNRTFTGTEEEKRETFRALFLDSIRLHMRADVEVGGCLSGGLDSSSIASVVSTLFPESKFKTFTIYYEGKGDVDERPWVNEVLKKYPNLIDFSFSPTEKDLTENFDKIIYHADVPMAGSSPISQYFVMQLAHQQKIKVLLDGQGSDEYLAGYMHSFYRLMGGLLGKLNLPAAIRELSAHSANQEFSLKKKADVVAKSILAGMKNEQSLYEMEYLRYFPFLMEDRNVNFNMNESGGSRLNRFLYHLTFTTSLPSLLHYEDRNSMAFSIESRVPFLDHRLVEFAFSLSDADKFRLGDTKHILRKSLNGIVPDSIINRKDKKGFVTPGEIKWLRGPLKHLLNVDYSNLDFVSKTKTKSILDDFIAGNNKNANFVWRIAVLNYWKKLN